MLPTCNRLFFWALVIWLSSAAFPVHLPANPLIRLYQDHISAIDGHRCPMKPSCSEYARKAVEKHGPVLGWIMACDRLLRCGRSEVSISPRADTSEGPRTVDTVEDNDFWWFSSHGKIHGYP